jgi:FKBP-type peptidyl-prolyl cis-trans isomerase FkpA
MLKKLSLYTLAFMGAIMLLSSCEKEYESIQDIDETRLQQYLKTSSVQFEKDSSGFYYRVDTVGLGSNFTDKDTVLYNVKVKSLGGGKEYFNSAAYSENLSTLVGYSGVLQIITEPRLTPLQVSMPAIRTAILGLKPGGTARVLLPSYLAFGKNGQGDINVPSNEPIELTIMSYSERSQAALDNRRTEEFLLKNNLTAEKDPSGVYYKIDSVGTGADVINKSSTITAKYTGRRLNGTVFDSSADSTFTSKLSGLVQGWQKVLPKLRAGGKIRIFVPSGLGYGAQISRALPANSVLDFDVKVVGVKN